MYLFSSPSLTLIGVVDTPPSPTLKWRQLIHYAENCERDFCGWLFFLLLLTDLFNIWDSLHVPVVGDWWTLCHFNQMMMMNPVDYGSVQGLAKNRAPIVLGIVQMQRCRQSLL